MRRSLLLITLFIALAGCTASLKPPTADVSASSASSSSSGSALLQTYANAKNKYFLQFPDGWVVKENDELSIPHYRAKGTSITPVIEQPNSTLLGAKFHVAVSYECPAQPYDATSLTIDGRIFKKSTWSMKSDGNLYHGTLWTVLERQTKTAKCYILTSFVENCNPGHTCDATHTTPYDEKAFTTSVEAMVQSFRLQ